MAKKHKGKLELNWVDKGDIIVTKFDDKGKTEVVKIGEVQIEIRNPHSTILYQDYCLQIN